MSKSKGNGIDPLIMIGGGKQPRFGKEVEFPAYGADAVRYTLCALTTEGQDVKLAPTRFEQGRNFINKVWNVSRFVMMNVSGCEMSSHSITPAQLGFADRWILSRLQAVTEQMNAAFDRFAFSELATTLYDFIWRDYCDWYVEMVKPSFRQNSAEADISRRVLVFALDGILRLLHPIAPFFTEEAWSLLRGVAPLRGIGEPTAPTEFVMLTTYPESAPEFRNKQIEITMNEVQEIVRATRNIRTKFKAPEKQTVDLYLSGNDEAYLASIADCHEIIKSRAGVGEIVAGVNLPKPPVSAAEALAGAQIFVPLSGFMNVEVERARVAKDLEKKEKSLHAVNLKLRDNAFLEGAPEKVVAAERARAADLTDQIYKLREWIAGLQ
jgi:valyl-tRNA synthetase